MSIVSLTSRQLLFLRRRLLNWFARHHRDLPWRRDRDPYRIWVSEVMLQQTTVATVGARFENFLKEFPTVNDLACADEQRVLRLWEGLGYYRRARDLHRSARQLVASHAGELPDDPDVWRDLPGVGRYILGAVLSQAFDRRVPIVEANSQRLLCRLFGQRGDPSTGPVKSWLWQTAEAILPRRRAGDFNQALMELGALVCTPTAPRCEDCPLASICVACQNNLQEIIPTKPTPPKIEQVREAAVVLRNGPKVLLVRRPSVGRWANMWEFPHHELKQKETHEQSERRLLTRVLGVRAEIGAEIMTIRHAVTRFRITMVCHEAIFRSGLVRTTHYPESLWLEPAELKNYPVSTPQRKLADEIARASRQLRLF
jgi:A/G-specific adenine glycosylase